MLITEKQLSCTFLDRVTRQVSCAYLEDLDSPTSLGVYLCLKYGDDISACSHEVDPVDFLTADEFRDSYLAAQLLSKFRVADKAQQDHRRALALEKFSACEDRLRDSFLPFQECVNRSNTAESRVFSRAQEKIAQILGPVSRCFDIDRCGFGPGSSSSVPRRKAHPSNKFLSADVSSGCAPFVSWFFQDAGFPRPKLNLVEHSRIEYVPKSFKIDRIIAVEPDWNIFFQKGFGSSIRSCLRRVGLDLDHCAETHGVLARESSLSDQLATIDLSAASDSIATFLIRYLLPYDWFVALNSVRTDRVNIDGEVRSLRKFSSMGNGFTFELESLVFFALAKSVCAELRLGGRVSVFGDDIIIPKAGVDLLRTVLEIAGFKFNQQKSFASGPFRESCGAHFFLGRNVKPIFIKENLHHDFEKFKLCNAIRRLSHRSYHLDVFGGPLLRSYNACKRRISRVFYIPEGYGDGGLISSFDEVSPSTFRGKQKAIRRYGHGIEGYRVRCLQPVARRETVDHDGMLVHKLRSSVLRKTSIWHLHGVPLWRISLKDLRRADYLPSVGNDISVSTGFNGTTYRIGTMHVPYWLDPGKA